MKFKKSFMLLLLMLLSLSSVFVIKANEEKLLVTITTNNNEVENFEIKEKYFNLKYDETKDNLIIRDEKSNLIKQIKIEHGDDSSIKFNYIGDLLVELDGNSDYYNGICMVESDQALFTIKSGTSTIILKDSVFYDDSEGFNVNIRWNFRAGDIKRDVFVNDVKNPLSIEKITELSGIFAFDKHDGDISHKITIEEDSYTSNKDQVGTNKVIYKVVNMSGEIATYTLNIVNMYYGKPVISGETELEFEYSEDFNIEEIIKDYKVHDEYDKDIKFFVAENTVVDTVVGNYHVLLKAISKTSQVGLLKINVKITDRTKPYFVDKHTDIITYNFHNLPSNKQLLEGLEAFDDYDGDLTNKIVVRINRISSIVGEYEVTYDVADKAGNRETHSRFYRVTSDYVPEFFVSKGLLSIEDAYILEIDEIAKIISEVHEIEMISYVVVEDTYTSNANIIGEYKVSMVLTDIELEDHLITQKISVFNLSEDSNNKSAIFILIGVGILVLTLNVVFIKKIRNL